MAHDKAKSLEESIERLRQACLKAGVEAHTVFSKSSAEAIIFAHEHRIATTELFQICATLIEDLNALERELLISRESRLH